jgi:hypothetical protein
MTRGGTLENQHFGSVAVVNTRVCPRTLPPTIIEAPTSETTAPNPAMTPA